VFGIQRKGPGDSYKEGGDCVIEWTADPTGVCTNMQIELKTGNNWAMTPLKGVKFSLQAQRCSECSLLFYSDHYN